MSHTSLIERLERRTYFAFWINEIFSGNTKTLFLVGTEQSESVTVEASVNPPGSARPYKFQALGQAIDADDLQVYGYGGADTIEINKALVPFPVDHYRVSHAAHPAFLC